MSKVKYSQKGQWVTLRNGRKQTVLRKPIPKEYDLRFWRIVE